MIHPWLEPLWQRLSAPEARLPHALLFAGPSGLGKRELAETLAARLLCDRPTAHGVACGACGACVLRVSGNHPDLLRIVPESEAEQLTDGESEQKASKADKGDKAEKAKSTQILIEQIRDLQQALSVTGHQSERRVILIDPAEAMNVFTANALLKLLEEPPVGCTFMLLSDEPLRLLPTIRSRCQQWRVAVPSDEQRSCWLAAQPGLSAELLAVNGGMPLAALRMADQGAAALLTRFVRDVSSLPGADVLALAAQWETWIKSKDAIAAGFGMPQLIDWMHRWVTDLTTLRLGGRVRYFPQGHAMLDTVCGRVSVAAVLNCYNEFARIRRVSHHPLNARLTLEDMLMRYARAVSGPRQ